jgi:hypothetical protein
MTRQYECGNCGSLEDGDGWPCNRCEQDVWLPLDVEPCPNGVTAADWSPGKTDPRCDSDNHHWRTGEHRTPVDL